jgi:uncharacterized repeat protein (TIGR04138 family)
MQQPGLMEVARRDSRFAYEAYEFLFEALGHTQRMLGKTPPEPTKTDAPAEHHVSGAELMTGICDLAKREFGRMARVVFSQWGINSTGDWGDIVFNLIEANLLSKTDNDSRADFRDLFDLDDVLVRDFRIEPEEVED